MIQNRLTEWMLNFDTVISDLSNGVIFYILTREDFLGEDFIEDALEMADMMERSDPYLSDVFDYQEDIIDWLPQATLGESN